MEEEENPFDEQRGNKTLRSPLLHVYVQYGKPPSHEDHDFRFMLYSGKPIQLVRNKTRVANVEIIDKRTLFMWSFDEFKYGGADNRNITGRRRDNRTLLYMALYYDGAMPDIQRFSNPYTYDILELAGSFNFSLISFCAKCSYWNEKEEKWKSDGCEVCDYPVFLQLIATVVG